MTGLFAFRRFLPALFVFLSYMAFAQNEVQNDSAQVLPFEISNLTQAADETETLIKELNEKIAKHETSFRILSNFQQFVKSSNKMRLDTAMEDLEKFNQWSLTDIQNKWSRYENQIDGFKKSMNDLSLEYQEDLNEINIYKARWGLTEFKSEEFEVPEALKDRSVKAIALLEENSQVHKDSLSLVLERLEEISSEYNYAISVQQKIKSVSDSKKLSIFAINAKPFFEEIRTRKDSTNLANQITNTWGNTVSETLSFIRENKDRSELHFLFVLLITGLFYYFKYLFNKNKPEIDESMEVARYLMNKPLWVSLTINLFISFWVYPSPPSFIIQIILFCLLIPVMFLLPGMTQKRYRLVVYITAFLYLLNQTEEFMPVFPSTQRILIMLEAIISAAGLIYVLRPKGHIYRINNEYKRWLIRLAIMFLAFSIISIYGNISGRLSLAKVLMRTVIINATIGIALYYLYRILTSLISFLFVSKAGQVSNLIRLQGVFIKKKTFLYLRIGGFYLWARNLLSLLGIKSFVQDSFSDLMEVGWDFGDVYLSIGQVLRFILILIIFSIIANILRALLQVEILPRFNPKKGIPMAAGLVTRYTVLVLGFLMAVAAAGISLDKLGFIMGALGVGIGFGLQSVVGNFVSGLILIFERPVRVGDIVTASTVEGEITDIGIRASKIRDWDGAEVIVPNMELISKHVTNWTLSDSKRRRELFIKTEYGTDPQQVIDIITKVIESNPGTIPDPKPMVLFLGFKEFSLDFRVLFWVTENMLTTTSEVAVGIHDALKAKGIKIPIPKRTIVHKGDAGSSDMEQAPDLEKKREEKEDNQEESS